MRSSDNPQEVMLALADKAEMLNMIDPRNHKKHKPGQLVLQQPQHIRDVLKQLKSDDIARICWPLWK